MSTENNDPSSPLKVVALANGKKTIIPSCVELLNPEKEGKKLCLYFVWPLSAEDPEHPCNLQETIDGKGLGCAFGYFTDFDDLYKLGRHDTPMLRARFKAATVDYMDMTKRLCRALSEKLDEGVEWGYAWCICDASGNKVPIGTSPIAVVNKKSVWND
ncbi:MAG: hypothetical protein EGQ22_01580 [Senegalimassilia anaerobia]|nr:hypothetical protein [Senegalimassilia anaerobia]